MSEHLESLPSKFNRQLSSGKKIFLCADKTTDHFTFFVMLLLFDGMVDLKSDVDPQYSFNPCFKLNFLNGSVFNISKDGIVYL